MYLYLEINQEHINCSIFYSIEPNKNYIDIYLKT